MSRTSAITLRWIWRSSPATSSSREPARGPDTRVVHEELDDRRRSVDDDASLDHGEIGGIGEVGARASRRIAPYAVVTSAASSSSRDRSRATTHEVVTPIGASAIASDRPMPLDAP